MQLSVNQTQVAIQCSVKAKTVHLLRCLWTGVVRHPLCAGSAIHTLTIQCLPACLC